VPIKGGDLLASLYVRGGWIVQRPDSHELVELMRTKDAAVTSQVFKAVRDDGNE